MQLCVLNQPPSSAAGWLACRIAPPCCRNRGAPAESCRLHRRWRTPSRMTCCSGPRATTCSCCGPPTGRTPGTPCPARPTTPPWRSASSAALTTRHAPACGLVLAPPYRLVSAAATPMPKHTSKHEVWCWRRSWSCSMASPSPSTPSPPECSRPRAHLLPAWSHPTAQMLWLTAVMHARQSCTRKAGAIQTRAGCQ